MKVLWGQFLLDAGVKYLYPVVTPIRDVDIALTVHRNPVGSVKLPVRIAFVAPSIEE